MGLKPDNTFDFLIHELKLVAIKGFLVHNFCILRNESD
jgi:hypothetical protein